MFRPNGLKRSIARGVPAFGVMHALGHPAVAEMIGLSGCDFVIIDGEHGLGDPGTWLGCIQAVSATPAHAVLRLPHNDPQVVKRVLDLGVEGVMAPDIRSAEDAAKLVAACRYPPRGVRGYAASGVRASDYGFQTERYLRAVEDELLVVAMIENRQGVANAFEIAAVEGVDVIQIGANDLGYDLGAPGDFSHPPLLEAIARIEAAARAAGKALGGAPLPGSSVENLIELGYGMITIGRDVGFLGASLSAALAAARRL